MEVLPRDKVPGPTLKGRPSRLPEDWRHELATLRREDVLLIPDDPTQSSRGRGYLHDMQMLVHSFARRNNLPKFSTWKDHHPVTGEKVLAIALRGKKK